MNAFARRFVSSLALCPILLASAGAQEPAAEGKGAAPQPDLQPPKERQNVGLPQISVIDKLLAAEFALGPALKRSGEDAWAAEYKSLYGKYKKEVNPGLLGPSRPALALALGIKASDGVLALKGRDIEALNACAEQIEKIAAKLQVPEGYLGRAGVVKRQATQQRWIEAFTELARLQNEIMRHLEANPEQKDDAMLVVIGAWLQGGRCVTALIQDHYTPESSNILREPKLVALMAAEMNKINAGYKADPVVQEVLKFLPEAKKHVDVGLRDPVKPEAVKALHEGFNRLVEMVVKPVAP